MSKIIQTCRQGFSLLEVLVSVFVVLIGLLGVATMIPAGRYEILQARKADMGADLSRAVMNSVVAQISNGWNPNNQNYYIVFIDSASGQPSGNLAQHLSDGFGSFGLTLIPKAQRVNNDKTFNGDDDLAIIEGDNNQFQLAVDDSGKVIGTGVYTACATVVSLDNGYYEVTGLAVYRYNRELDATDYKSGSYAFFTDGSGKQRWYKIENVNTTGRQGITISTMAGDKTTRDGFKYLGDVIGICRKVVRIDDSYTVN